MTRLLIAVGSTRKPKLAAVHQALDDIGSLLAPAAQIEVTGFEVESGVAHTPTSREELMSGARQRAEGLRALTASSRNRFHYFIGLEGGLDVIGENGARRVFLESWAYVSDGERGYYGRSGALELPAALADEVLHRGTELAIAIDRFAEQTGIRDAQGVWGVLSGNKITRQEAFRVAIIAAFAPFYNGAMYRKSAAAFK